MPKELTELEAQFDISFNNKDLLRQVFVHRSYLNENSGFDLEHNERLEFLGDAVLELVVTEYLYKNYPNPEGELTNWRSALVRGVMLAEIAGEMGMGDYLLLSRGEQKSGGKARQLILANTFEAFVGALYLDKGYAAADDFVARYLLIRLPDILENQLYMDPKSKLQELSQEKWSVTPVYKVIGESGPDHAKSFTVGVFIENKQLGVGSGTSKQNAEQSAASDALQGIAKAETVAI
jgi:ribonuclease-3